jgi:hypothetical protein
MTMVENDETSYMRADIHSLIIISIDNIVTNNEDCTFERLVYECFTNFPKIFSLFRYPQWPDSNKLDRPLRKLRERGFIVGSPKVGFLLTEDGRHRVVSIKKSLERQIGPKRAPRMLKGKERNLVVYIKSSDLYMKFKNDKHDFELTEQDFIDFLRGTLETPRRVLKQTLVQYKNLAEQIGDVDLQQFLLTCEAKMGNLLNRQ